jgi:hypothetical protein
MISGALANNLTYGNTPLSRHIWFTSAKAFASMLSTTG